MKTLRLISWNVNGLRAVHRKGFLEWLSENGPDILCLQETKASEDQLPDELRKPSPFRTWFAAAQKRGYSGVALLSKPEPSSVDFGLGKDEFDREGRVIIANYPWFTLFNIYFPNGKASSERLRYKMAFNEYLLSLLRDRLKKGERIVVCGDVNTAHKEIDLARPKENQHISGFLPEEREWIDRLLEAGFADAFRLFEQEGGRYSWWDLKTRARERNVGWRIDYFFVSENLREKVKGSLIHSEVQGSDHCPVSLELLL